MDATNRMPGDAEAAGAVAGMRDIYGGWVSVGDFINWRRDAWPSGRSAKGRVLEVHDGGLVVELDGEPMSVAAREVMPF